FMFLLLIILIMTVLLSRMAVYADIKKIGILKSIGFTDFHISLSYILQYVMTAVTANVFGVLLAGLVLQIWLSGMFANIDRNLFVIQNLWRYGLLTIFIIGIFVYLAVGLSIHQIVHMPPIEAIKNTDTHKKWGDLCMPMPRFLQVNLAFIKCMCRKSESAFIFALTLGMSLLYLLAVYMIDGVKHADSHLTDWGIVEMDVYVSRKTNTDERESGLLKALENDSAVHFYYAGLSDNITYRLEGNSFTRKVIGEVYDKEIPEGLDYIFTAGRNPQTGNEAAVGINFASKNHVGIGDKVYITRYGEETELEIVGIYPSFKQYGDSIRFLTDDIQEFSGTVQMVIILSC
ncbi:MAG: ABC transporter permease, partial [Lachnospiraceae bacterium]|nr:ABC transporter permease [Lachnospiraceae bacterium]